MWKVEININNKKGLTLEAVFPFDCFFDCIPLYAFNEIIEVLVRENGFNYQSIIEIIYPNSLDEYDIVVLGITVPVDCVMCRYGEIGSFEESIMKKNDFERMLLEYSKKLLEIHHDNKSLPRQWAGKMDISIRDLEHKLLNYPPQVIP